MISLCFFPLPPVNRREALRYAGAKAETPELSLLLDAVLADITPHLQGKVCWIDTPIRRQGDILDLGFAKTNSAALARNLVGCDRAVVFAATLGLEFDRVLDCPRKIGLTLNESLLMSPSKSVTAIIGLGHPRESSCSGGCNQCSKTDCIYRSTP